MKVTLLSTLFIITSIVFSQNVDPKKANKLLKEAKGYVEVEEFIDALPILEKAYQFDPSNQEIAYNYGKVLVITGHEARALEPLKKAVKAEKPFDNIHFYLGVSQHVSHFFDDAVSSFDKYLGNPANAKFKELFAEAKRRKDMCAYAKKLVESPVNVKIRNLGPVINSKYPDYVPVISADETTLLFTSRRDNTTGGKRDKSHNDHFMEDIYISTRSDDTTWTTPVSVGNLINTDDHDACAGISPDGQKMFIYKSVKGTKKSGDLFYSELKGTVWGTPKSLGSNINSPDWEPSVSVTADENLLFFTSDRKGGLGGTDIYVSKRMPNGEYGPAKNLGSKVNTKQDDDAPFIHADGKTLYFSSKGHNTMGGFDIFHVTVDPETGIPVSDPVNIGYPINTADDDIYFVWSADGKRAYFSSEREGGYGDKDIYVLEREIADAKLIVMRGIIKDKETGDPVSANITVVDNETQKVVGVYNSNSSTGKYTVIFPAGKNYGISVEAPHYLFYSKNIDIPNLDAFKEIKDSIKLSPIKAGNTIVLRNVFFDYNKSTLTPQSENELMRVVKILNLNPTLKIRISGHTDSDGNDD
ncbi:MAG: OmpA family protein, partial [Cytophagales bacterium]